jgi:hypothetical protein
MLKRQTTTIIIMLRKYSLLFFFMAFLSCGDYCQDYLRPKQIKGKLITKYIDKNDHELKKMVIQDGMQQYILVIEERNPELWDYIENGDSIFKDTGNLDIIIKKQTNITTFNICN